MAQALLENQLARRRIHSVGVGSAGTYAGEGNPATDEAIEAMEERQIDITSHRARRLTPELIQQAELVVAMAAEHREAVEAAVPAAAAHTFTLKELVRLVDEFPGQGEGSSHSAEERLRAAVARASQRRAMGQAPAMITEDIADPLGLSVATYLAVAWELDGLTARLADRLFGEGWTEGGPVNVEALWGHGTKGGVE
jgi:protein-tyrosine-phosphatase